MWLSNSKPSLPPPSLRACILSCEFRGEIAVHGPGLDLSCVRGDVPSLLLIRSARERARTEFLPSSLIRSPLPPKKPNSHKLHTSKNKIPPTTPPTMGPTSILRLGTGIPRRRRTWIPASAGCGSVRGDIKIRLSPRNLKRRLCGFTGSLERAAGDEVVGVSVAVEPHPHAPANRNVNESPGVLVACVVFPCGAISAMKFDIVDLFAPSNWPEGSEQGIGNVKLLFSVPPRARPGDLCARVVHEDLLALQTGQFADSDDYVVECEPAEAGQANLKLRGIRQNVGAVDEPAVCGGGLEICGMLAFPPSNAGLLMPIVWLKSDGGVTP
ncbi:hypothetical protein C8J57DRAFT_1264676 [Mycena rebaudengoi]|nr:hypothetical protein C8J57DRAFT_1264676 [Mycena rebaudengoi]